MTMANPESTDISSLWHDVPVPDEFITQVSYNSHTSFPSFRETIKNIPQSQLGANRQKDMALSLESLNYGRDSKKLTGLESLKPGYKFPHHSQLTEGLMKYYLFLRSQYGFKGKRVDSETEAKQHQQWMNLQKQVMQEQEEFQTFAKQVAMASTDDFANFIPGAKVYLNNCLEANRQRVLRYPRHYRMNQSVNLMTDPALPSDPQLSLIQGPKYKNNVQLLSCKNLIVGKEEFLCDAVRVPTMPEMEQETKSLSQEECQEGVDIMISVDALATLIDNHQVENYPHQWEIPITVKTVKHSGKDGSSKTVVLEDPFMRHNYYPIDANRVLASKLLKSQLGKQGAMMRRKNRQTNQAVDYFQDNFCTKRRTVDHQEQETESFLFDDDITSLESLGSSSYLTATAERTRNRKSCPDQVEDLFDNDITALETLGGSSFIKVAADRTRSGKQNKSFEMKKINFVKSDQNLAEEKRALGTSCSLTIAESSSVVTKQEDERILIKEEEKEVKRKVSSDLDDKTDGKDDTVHVDNHRAEMDAKRDEFSDRNESNAGREEDQKKVTIKDKCVLNEVILRNKQQTCPGLEKKPSVNDHSSESHKDTVLELPEVEQRVTRGMAKKIKTCGTEVPERGSDISRVKESNVKGESSSTGSIEQRSMRSASRGGLVGTGETVNRVRTRSSSRYDLPGEVNKLLTIGGTEGNVDKDEDKREKQRKKTIKEANIQTTEMEADGIGDGTLQVEAKQTISVAVETNINVELEECTIVDLNKSSESDDGLRIDTTEDDDSDCLKVKDTVNVGEKLANRRKEESPTEMPPKMILRKRKADLGKRMETEAGIGKISKVEDTKSSPRANPLIDNILQLQKQLISATKEKKEVKQDEKDLKKEKTKIPLTADQQIGNFSLADILEDQTQLLKKMSSDESGPQVLPGNAMDEKPEGVEDEKAEVGLWKLGKLKVCMRGGIDGVYWEYRQKIILPATVFTKLEHQPWFGFEQVSIGESSRLWLNAAFFPHSVIVRGRIHCQSTNIMNWEILGMENIGAGSQFQPAYATKVLHNIFTKLLLLTDGSYLLTHRPGDPQAFIYSTVEEETAHRFIIYDLHAQHQAARLHDSPPEVIPWAPLDPNLVLPGHPTGPIACIFPPPPYFQVDEYHKTRRFNPHEGLPPVKKNNKKKRKRNRNRPRISKPQE